MFCKWRINPDDVIRVVFSSEFELVIFSFERCEHLLGREGLTKALLSCMMGYVRSSTWRLGLYLWIKVRISRLVLFRFSWFFFSSVTWKSAELYGSGLLNHWSGPLIASCIMWMEPCHQPILTDSARLHLMEMLFNVHCQHIKNVHLVQYSCVATMVSLRAGQDY